MCPVYIQCSIKNNILSIAVSAVNPSAGNVGNVGIVDQFINIGGIENIKYTVT